MHWLNWNSTVLEAPKWRYANFGNKVECCFDTVAKNGNNVDTTFDFVEVTFDFVAFDNVGLTLLLVWTEFKKSRCVEMTTDCSRRLYLCMADRWAEPYKLWFREVQLQPKRKEQCSKITDARIQTSQHGLNACDGNWPVVIGMSVICKYVILYTVRGEDVHRTFRVRDKLRWANARSLGHARRQRDRHLTRLCDEHLSATWEVRSEPLQQMTSPWRPGARFTKKILGKILSLSYVFLSFS